MNEINLTELTEAITAAATLAKQLAADPNHGRSQFAAAIRSAIDHANDLLAQQKQWSAANPPKP